MELSSLRGAVLGRAAVAYAVSFAIAAVVGTLLGAADIVMTPAFIAIILSATGMGAVIPIVRGAGLTTTSVGQTILVVASVAEFSAVLLLSLLFGEGDTSFGGQILFLVVFAAVTAVVWLGLRRLYRHPALIDRMESLEGGTAQLGIRLAVLLLGVFLAMSSRFGLETILGAFVAGIILGDLRHHERGQETGFWPKIDAIGFGFLIPFYFVISGLRFNLTGLLHSSSAIGANPCSSHSSCCAAACRHCCSAASSGRGRRPRSALLSATSLSFVLTATHIGVRIGKLRDINATVLVGAAVLAMLIFPLGAQSLLAGPDEPAAAAPDPLPDEV